MTLEEFKKKFGIIGRSKEINDLADIIMQVAVSDISVLIYGESGVGKEVFARAIHGYSKRSSKPLISVNCGAIPEGLMESELFGHKKGSFTGAIDGRKGYFEIADGGTLFLDEIGETPLTTQVKLLRVIEMKEYIKVGAETVSKTDVRLITATNQDLQQLVNARKFREDLYFRLKAVTVQLPPLRKRKEDIDLLAEHFLQSYCNANEIHPPQLTNDAIMVLREYNWPGNVRELKNTIETAVTLNRGKILDASALRHLIIQPPPLAESERSLPVFLKKSSEEVDRELMYRALFELKKDMMELKDLIRERNSEIMVASAYQNTQEVIPIQELEKEAIKNALIVAKGKKRTAAKMLNMSERTLYRKVKDYGI